MSDPSDHNRLCPACGSEDVSYWEGIESYICNECSCVLDADTQSHQTNRPTIEPASESSTAETNEAEWKQRITVTDQSEANLVTILSLAETLVDDIALTEKVATRAAEIIVEAWKENFTHGRKKEHVIAAAVYIASRETNNAVPPGRIADAIDTDKQSVKRTYITLKKQQGFDLQPPTPDEYIEWICNALDLPSKIDDEARCVLSDSSGSAGNPIGLAAASIYIAANKQSKNITFRQAADATKLTKETIWKHSSKISDE